MTTAVRTFIQDRDAVTFKDAFRTFASALKAAYSNRKNVKAAERAISHMTPEMRRDIGLESAQPNDPFEAMSNRVFGFATW